MTSEPTMPTPPTEIDRPREGDHDVVAERFRPIVGRWRTEGRIVDDGTPIVGWDTYELLPGGFFVVHHVDCETAGLSDSSSTSTQHTYAR